MLIFLFRKFNSSAQAKASTTIILLAQLNCTGYPVPCTCLITTLAPSNTSIFVPGCLHRTHRHTLVDWRPTPQHPHSISTGRYMQMQRRAVSEKGSRPQLKVHRTLLPLPPLPLPFRCTDYVQAMENLIIFDHPNSSSSLVNVRAENKLSSFSPYCQKPS